MKRIISFFFFLSAFAKLTADPVCDQILQLRPNLGITKEELSSIVNYIETELPNAIQKGKYYLRKEETGLCRTIEYDPVSKLTFIHLKRHGINALGKGRYKRVTYSIKYDKTAPELVANCILIDDGTHRVKKSIQHELTVTTAYPDTEGLAATYAVGKHTKKDASQVYSFIQKLYTGDSFKKYCIANRSTKWNDTMLFLARDFAAGLEALHRLDLVHADLHRSNMLLHKKYDTRIGRDRMCGVIIDFGHTQPSASAAKNRPRVEAGARHNPPEAFTALDVPLDTKAIDVYALGLGLYDLYFSRSPEWALKKYIRNVTKMDEEKKAATRALLLAQLTKQRKIRLVELKNDGSVEDDFVRLILQMVHPNPKRRGRALEIRNELSYLIMRNELQLFGNSLYSSIITPYL
jgi:serine/threonine protein kinase